jgi:hypothetical protein
MIDILEVIQDKYVPFHTVKDNHGDVIKIPTDILFFGGDQLTEERARNIQKARTDGQTTAERLDATWPKKEDWHGIRTADEVC